MSYWIDNNNTLHTSDLMNASDYNAVVNKYKNEIGLNYYLKNSGDLIQASDWNDLISTIEQYQNLYNISIPNKVSSGDIITSTSWGEAIANTVILKYTSNATYTIPSGCHRIRLNWILAAGGGGGGGMEYQYGGSGGSGGSGGYIQNYYINVTPGDILNIFVGQPGQGTTLNQIYWNYANYGNPATNGGNTYIQVNGQTVITVYGGGAGTNGSAYSGGIAGYAGSPNGNAGTNGIRGNSTHTGHAHTPGVDGASSIFGPGGAGGNANVSSEGNGSNATNYGAGGGSGANVDGASPNFWAGGNGGTGYMEIQLPV